MKKTIISLLICMLLAVACGDNGEGAVQFNNATTDKTVKLSNEELSPTCTVHLQLAYATEESGHKGELINETVERRLLDMQDLTMQQATDSFANSYTRSYVRNFLPLYNQDRADTTKRSWYEYHYVITTETRTGHKGTTVYTANLDYYEGGAHGINQLLTMNFDKNTGRQLTLADVFVPGYEQQLNTILLEALQEKVGAKSIGELHEMGYLFSMEMFPSENFILDEETITFIYNPYEIAPYAVGRIELVIAYDTLEKILNNSF